MPCTMPQSKNESECQLNDISACMYVGKSVGVALFSVSERVSSACMYVGKSLGVALFSVS